MGEALKREGRSPAERSPIAQSANDIFELAIKLCLLFFLVYWSVVLLRPFLSIALWSSHPRSHPVSRFFVDGPTPRRATEAGGTYRDSDQPSGLHRPHHLAGIEHDRGGCLLFTPPRHRRHLNPPSLRGDQVLAIYWRPRLLFLGPGRYEHKTGH